MIHLFYYTNNFGDELSPYIVSKLSNDTIKFAYPYNLRRFCRNLVAAVHLLIKGDLNAAKHAMSFTKDKVLIAVGSLIESATSNSVIWGSGMAQKDMIPTGGIFLCTRGKLSYEILKRNGFDVKSDDGGDPALLLPLIYAPKSQRIPQKIGVVCHNDNYDEIKKSLSKYPFEIIGLKTTNVEDVIDKINSCSFVYTTSLHGLIVSHAYGVPAQWIEKDKLDGGWFKFHDYLSSVGLPLYEPYKLNELIENKFELKMPNSFLLPQEGKISSIQQSLLRLVPFKIECKLNFK